MSTPSLISSSEPTGSSYAAAVELWPLEPGDHGTVQAIFAGLGPLSCERRFLIAKPRLTSADLRRLTAVDDHAHVAVVARSGSDRRPVGVARFVRDRHDPHSADVALVVADGWQNRGVGTTLAAALVRRARGPGVRRFTEVTAPDNEAALRLVHRAPGEVERLVDDDTVAELAITLARTSPGAAQPSTGTTR